MPRHRSRWYGTATTRNNSNDDGDGDGDGDDGHRGYSVPIVVEMPSLNEEEEEEEGDDGVVVCVVERWHKRPGDVVERDDVLCEISTPYGFGFGMQIDDDEEGRMGAVHVDEGVGVEPGTPLCTIYHRRRHHPDE